MSAFTPSRIVFEFTNCLKWEENTLEVVLPLKLVQCYIGSHYFKVSVTRAMPGFLPKRWDESEQDARMQCER